MSTGAYYSSCMKTSIQDISGVIPPIVTPLTDDGTVDSAGLTRLIDHVLAGGVHGIFILGTTGEGPSLSMEQKCSLIEHSCRAVRGRVPVLVGVTDTSFCASIALAEHAARCGADAVVAAPPYYMPPSQPELLDYIEHLAARLPLPLFLYNMPAMTKVSMEIATVERAVQVPNVVGIKDSSCNMIYMHELIKTLTGRIPVFVGPEELLGESVIFGAAGGVPGGANIDPALYVGMFDAARANDMLRVKALQERIFSLRELYRVGHYASSGIKGIKCALSLMGICSDRMAEPFRHFNDPERERVRSILAKNQVRMDR